MRFRLVVLLTPALLAACDSHEDGTAALFTVQVTLPDGTPIPGLNLFVVYGGAEPRVLPGPIEPPGGGTLLSPPSPNPSTGSARIRLAVDKPQHVEVAIYNLEDELLATLADETLSAGVHAF